MNKILLITTCILSFLLAGCRNDEPSPDPYIIRGDFHPYGIIENVNSIRMCFWTGGGGLTSGWINAPGDWDPDNPGIYKYIDVESTFKGSWSCELQGNEISHLSDSVRYKQLCLSWGMRLDYGYRASTDPELEGLPLNLHFPVVFVINHGIKGMDLITEREFDADHPAGSSLKDITNVMYRSVEPAFNWENLDYKLDIVCMADLNASTMPRIDRGISVKITKNPQQAGTYVFRQYIYFADGRVIENRFKRVWLKEHLALDPLESDPQALK